MAASHVRSAAQRWSPLPGRGGGCPYSCCWTDWHSSHRLGQLLGREKTPAGWREGKGEGSGKGKGKESGEKRGEGSGEGSGKGKGEGKGEGSGEGKGSGKG